MTKARMHPALLEFRGAMGDMVFRKRNGKVYVSIKPDMSNVEASPAQAANRVRFRKAAAYSRSALADPTLREFYERVAQERNTPLFAVPIADFFHAPVVEEIDLSSYNGQAGDPILIEASDDLGVVSVQVIIIDGQDTSVESGFATQSPTGWVYTATATLPHGTNAYIKVLATDRPGGTGLMKTSKIV